VAAARRLGPGIARARILELGPPCCPGAPMAFRDPADAEAILDEAWREVADRGAADALMVRDFAGTEFSPLEHRLEAMGFALLAQRPTFIARIDAGGFAGYLAAMRASYRRRAERYLAADLRVSTVAGFGDRAEEIARLCAVTTARSTESRRERVDAEVVRGWERCDRARAVLIESPAGALELAALTIEDPPVLHFVRVGFEVAAGRASGVYPRLLYELVRRAAEGGFSFVDLGLTSADPKLRAGGQPVPLRVWARHRNPALQALLRHARPLLARAPSTPERHVFRDPPGPVHPTWYG
jgi:hypothetical protein